MDAPLKIVSAREVRALIAHTYLGARSDTRQLGRIRLHDHQLDAVQRLRTLLSELGGALLADEVGLGKTYSALAVAAEYARVLIVAPASLIAMWKESATVAGVVHAAFASHEALSRRTHHSSAFDLIVVDEAHHARNPATRRYAALARMAIGARVLLLSATPVHNSEHDLRALFALFLGSTAWTCAMSVLARAVVRRQHGVVGATAIPRVKRPVCLELTQDNEVLEHILALPPPVPPRDGGDGGALVTHGLVRQWASSDAALMRALMRRKARAIALTAALEEGRHPDMRELQAWEHSEDAVQLAFPCLAAPATTDSRELLASVRAHERGVSELLVRLKSARSIDMERAQHIARLRVAHPGARIVAFTQFADTAHAIYSALAPAGGLAALTARGAVTAGGRMTRAEAVLRFTEPTVRSAERIDVLIATDLLSEGINLPDASVIVHLDLPWTPARLEQRVGRAVRLGSRHNEVFVYHMMAPASASALLRVEEILARKLGDAVRTVGMAGAILPSLQCVTREPESPSAIHEQIHGRLCGWLDPACIGESEDGTAVACVAGTQHQWLALLRTVDTSGALVSGRGGATSDDVAAIARMLEDCEAPDRPVPAAQLSAALADIRRWSEYRAGNAVAALSVTPAARSGARLLKRIGTIAQRAPYHRRTAIASLAHQARRAVLTPRGIGAERVLAELVDSSLGDDAWLRAVGAFATANAEAAITPEPHHRIVALLLICPV